MNPVLAVVSVLTLAGSVSTECPDTWIPFKGSCYHLGHSLLTFQEAEQFCVHYGAHLVHIGSTVENTFIKSYLSDLIYPYFWIGLRDDITEGLWTWYDADTSASFTSWAPGEPNGGHSENCVIINKFHAYNWDDVSCTRPFTPVCELRYNRWDQQLYIEYFEITERR